MIFPSISPDTEQHGERAAEVLELGEMLFDAVIEVATNRQTMGEESDASFPAEDVRAAADEFFRALRVLLGIEPESK